MENRMTKMLEFLKTVEELKAREMTIGEIKKLGSEMTGVSMEPIGRVISSLHKAGFLHRSQSNGKVGRKVYYWPRMD